jgi:hypothetical protein
MRLRLSDPTLIEEFLEFLWRSGFIAELDAPDAVKVSLPMAVADDRTPADVELFLGVWVNVSVRVWKDLWPHADVAVVVEAKPARPAVPGAPPRRR